MSTIISSPGVQINEIDLTSNARQSNGLTVAVVGYANEGPVLEPTYVSSVTELEDIFGAPTNAAERYFYHSARQVLSRSLAQALVVRLPYDNSNAVDTRNVLVYPVSTNNIDEYWGKYVTPKYQTAAAMLDEATEYVILPPVSMLLTQAQYEQEVLQKTFDWERTVEIPSYGVPATSGGPAFTVAPASTSALPGFNDVGFRVLSGTEVFSGSVSAYDGELIVGDLFTGLTVRAIKPGASSPIGSTSVSADDVTGLVAGLTVVHPGIPAGAKIVSIDSSTNEIVLDKSLTGTVATGSLSFSHGLLAGNYISFGDVQITSTPTTVIPQSRIQDSNVAFLIKAVSSKRLLIDLNNVKDVLADLRVDSEVIIPGPTPSSPSTLAYNEVSGTIDGLFAANGRKVLPRFPVALIVADTNQGIQTNLFEGMYVGLSDNSGITNDTSHNCLSGIKALNGVKDSDDKFVGIQNGVVVTQNTHPILRNLPFGESTPQSWGGDPSGTAWIDTVNNYDYYTTWQTVPAQRYDFKMTSTLSTAANNFINVANSISEIVEKIPFGYPVYTDDYKDTVIFSVFKLKKSIYSLSTDVLTYTFNEGHIGSLYSRRQQSTSSGGPAQSFFIEEVVSASSKDFILQVSPYISQSPNWIKASSDTTSTGIVPEKTVKIHGDAKNLYSIGTYSVNDAAAKKLIGNLPEKLDKALKLIEDPLTYPLDLIIDAGLSTIWPTVRYKFRTEFDASKDTAAPNTLDQFKKAAYFSDEDGFPQEFVNSIKSKNTDFITDPVNGPISEEIVANFRAIQQYFTSFAGDNRKDLVYIADPLRQVFVKGRDYKTESRTGFNFTAEVFWPLYHLFDPIKSSYVATYANWVKINDSTSAKNIWIPSSGVVAGMMMLSDQNFYPWSAVAGFNRGAINGLVDVALTPSQRNRDLLYKISMNPIANFINDGIVIFGQKTMFTKPSAFDRLNVRRLFITLEKFTSRAVKYFVFEPNSFVTRNRLVATLQPVFEQAKLSDGLFDYRIVCDERNNTPDVIDNNELKVDIYIKPTRTAEFILVNFYATRTSQNFDEILPL